MNAATAELALVATGQESVRCDEVVIRATGHLGHAGFREDLSDDAAPVTRFVGQRLAGTAAAALHRDRPVRFRSCLLDRIEACAAEASDTP